MHFTSAMLGYSPRFDSILFHMSVFWKYKMWVMYAGDVSYSIHATWNTIALDIWRWNNAVMYINKINAVTFITQTFLTSPD